MTERVDAKSSFKLMLPRPVSTFRSIAGPASLLLPLALLRCVSQDTYFYLSLKGQADEHPEWTIAARPLDLVVAQPLPAHTLTASGFQFDVPWSGMAPSQRRKLAVTFTDSSGRRIMAMRLAKGHCEMMRTTAMGHPDIAKYFPPEVRSSSFEFCAAAARTTWEDVSWMTSGSSTRSFFLLQAKSSLGLPESAREGLFLYRSKFGRGIQAGDPRVSRAIFIRSVEEDGAEFELVVGRKLDSDVNLDQSELNVILSTLRPAPDGSTGP